MSARESTVVRPEELLAHAGWLRQLAFGLVRGSGDPEDLVQATYLAALRSPPAADLPIRRWLAQVLRNVWRMRGRSASRRAYREEEFASAEYAEGAPTPEGLLARFQTQRQLADLVADLEEPYRSTVLLRYQEGLSSADIARMQDVPPGTVRWRLMTGLEKLRKALDTKNEGDRGAWMAMLLPFAQPLKAAPAKGAATLGLKLAAAAVLAIGAPAVIAGVVISGSVQHAPGASPARPPAPEAEIRFLPAAPPSAAAPLAAPEAPAPPPAILAPARPGEKSHALPKKPEPAVERKDAPVEAPVVPTAAPSLAPARSADPGVVGGTVGDVANGVLNTPIAPLPPPIAPETPK
jgi:RNA polymerase sigma factor (sigma-70 family)